MSRLFGNAEQLQQSVVPVFCSETLCSCSEVHNSCLVVRSSCSEMVFSYSNKMPFWYSKSLALDPARSHSRWVLWTFCSISFTASFSFAFSSMRGSIRLISCCHCAAVRAIPYRAPRLYKTLFPNTKDGHHRHDTSLNLLHNCGNGGPWPFQLPVGLLLFHDHHLIPLLAEDPNSLRS